MLQISVADDSKSAPEVRRLRKRGAPGVQKSAPRTPLSRLVTFILRQSGLEPGGYQPKALNRRVAACLRALKEPSEEAVIAALSRKPQLLEVSLSALLIGVSEFFRDEGVFEELRQAVLPQMLEENRAVRVYSAGCSAGYELYSVAIILDELGGLQSSHLVGVDCRADAIEQARSGEFAASDLKGLEATRRQRYFGIEGGRAFISPPLRQKTVWHVADFGVFGEVEPWDLILFRNAAIYLERDYANRVWHGLGRQLKPGGVVVTGTADRPPEDLCLKRESPCIYRKSLRQS